MRRAARDPQVELVRRYARILRSAPAEALRSRQTPRMSPPRFPRTGTTATAATPALADDASRVTRLA